MQRSFAKAVILSVVVAAAVAGCASTPTVHTDSNPSTNFANYRTYTWVQKPRGMPPLNQDRFVAAVNAKLSAAGWSEAADGQVSLVANVATQQEQSLDTFYSGPMYAGWGWRGGWGGMGMGMGSATTTVRNYTVGTLVLDMFDSSTKQAIWRGTAEGTVPSSPQRLDAAVQAAVDKMFAGFPPGSAPAAK